MHPLLLHHAGCVVNRPHLANSFCRAALRCASLRCVMLRCAAPRSAAVGGLGVAAPGARHGGGVGLGAGLRGQGGGVVQGGRRPRGQALAASGAAQKHGRGRLRSRQSSARLRLLCDEPQLGLRPGGGAYAASSG